MIYQHVGNGYFRRVDMKPHLASIVPKNPEQIMLANSLVNKDIPLVSMIGRAGTGKTLLAIAAAIQQVLIKH
jgi:PhoH-like ATPase